jgi:hypothetical protein
VLDIVKGKIVEPEFEEGKEKELQNVAVMEKFKVLVVEPDYLPDSGVLAFSRVYTP